MRQARLRAIISIIIISVLITGTVGYAYAKYVFSETSAPVGLTAGSFFFDTSTMPDGETQKNITVMDGRAVSESFSLCNYEDGEHITKKDIEYTASISCNNLFSGFSANINGAAFGSESVYTLSGGTADEHAFLIEIESGYENGTILQLTIVSKSPYKKTIIYKFNLFDMPGGSAGDINYIMKDSPGQAYTSLQLSSFEDTYVTLDWRASYDEERDRYDFLIDMTSEYILTDADTDGNGTPDIEEGFTVVYVPVGQAIDITFFMRNANEKFKVVSDASGETLFINPTLNAAPGEDKTYDQNNPYGHTITSEIGRHYSGTDNFDDFPVITKDSALTVQFICGYVSSDFDNIEWFISSDDDYNAAYFPVGTKITFIDQTKGETDFYYYTVSERYVSDINLMDFISMGRTANGRGDAFAGYFGADDIYYNTLENFVFVFDFSSASDISDMIDFEGFSVISLKHKHGTGGIINDVYYWDFPLFFFNFSDTVPYSRPANYPCELRKRYMCAYV